MEMSDRMKGMKLGNFSGIKKPPAEPTKPPEPARTSQVGRIEFAPLVLTRSQNRA